MANDQFPTGPTGPDAIKGGIFFGSQLTPSGTFPNVPKSTSFEPPTEEQQVTLVLTLEQIKAGLQDSAQQELGTTDDSPLSDQALNSFLTSTVQLLIDYRDIRNFVFFGSAYTEIAYNVNYILENYPFKSFFARDTGLGLIEINALIGGQTEILFDSTEVLQPADFSYKEDGVTQWPDFEIVDELGNVFPIVSFRAPAGIEILAASNADPVVITTITPHGLQAPPYNFIPPFSPLFLPLVLPDQVNIYDIQGNTISNGDFYANVLSPTTFELYEDQDLAVPIPGNGAFVANTGARMRPLPLDYSGVYKVRIKVDDLLNANNLVDFEDEALTQYKGLLISPPISLLTDFDLTQTPVQNQLLASFPTNPTPWPRSPITNNIETQGMSFDDWLSNPDNLFVDDPGSGDDGASGAIFSDLSNTLNLDRALSLDETGATNQIINRMIPHRVINELNDTEDAFFQRFILLAGQMFDIIKSFIEFLKYTKSLNYTPYDQLSPEFHKLFAEHYGFDLFDDESIDFTKLLIRTEPGLRYDALNNPIFDSRAEAQTLKELQAERQKRLLINLFSLYERKGTQAAIEMLVSLLGAPEGLLVLKEYGFQIDQQDDNGYALNYSNPSIPYVGTKIVNNDKVHVPEFFYEIDPSCLVNPDDIEDPVNLPYKYRLRLKNEETHNLREISILTDPQAAIAQDIISFGKSNHRYFSFDHRGFANLQPDEDAPAPFYLLPLTLPDKYYGITTEYMIPRNGFTTGSAANNYDEVVAHIGSLYQVGSIGALAAQNIVDATNLTPIEITTTTPHGLPGDGISVQVDGVLGNTAANGTFIITLTSPTSFTLDGSIGNGGYAGGGSVQQTTATKIFGNRYAYPLTPEIVSEAKFVIEEAFALPVVGTVKVYINPQLDNLGNVVVGPSLFIGEAVLTTSLKQMMFDLVNDINANLTAPDYRAHLEPYETEAGPFTITILDEFGSGSQSNGVEVGVVITGDIQVPTASPIKMQGGVDTQEDKSFVINRLEGRDLVTRIGMSSEIVREPLEISNVNTGMTPLQVQTAVPHGLVAGDEVTVEDVQGVPQANGTFTAQIVSTTIIQLVGTSSGGAYAIGTGTIRPLFTQRVAIVPDCFEADGLNHQLRIIFRPRGVEVYKDFKFVMLAPWLDPRSAANGPFSALDIPKGEILTCTPALFPVLRHVAYPDNESDIPVQLDEPRWWDLFVGLPHNIDFNFLRVATFEAQSINQADVLASGIDPNTSFESEVYSFEANKQNEEDFLADNKLSIIGVFRQPSPDSPGASADHFLPTALEDTVPDLILHSQEWHDGTADFEIKRQHFYDLPDNIALTVDSLFTYNAWTKSIHKDYTYDNYYNEAFDNYELFAEQILTYSSLLSFLGIIEEKFDVLVEQFIPIVINVPEFGRIIRNNPFDRKKVRYDDIHIICDGSIIGTLARGEFRITSGVNDPGVSNIEVEIDGVISLATVDWASLNTVTADAIATAINGASPYFIIGGNVDINATTDNNIVVITINPEQYLTATGNDVNLADLKITPGPLVTVDQVDGFDNGQIEQTGDDCFVVTRTPVSTLKGTGTFIYYDIEDGPETYLYYDVEGIPPAFINFD